MTLENLVKLQRSIELDRVTDQLSGAVLLVDVSSEEWTEIEGIQPTFIEAATTEQLSFADEQFDAVVALPRPGEPVHLDECLRVLKENGRLVFRRAPHTSDSQDGQPSPFALTHISETAAQIGCQIDKIIPYAMLCDNESLYELLGESAEATKQAFNQVLYSDNSQNTWRIIEQAICAKLPIESSSRHIVITRKVSSNNSQVWSYQPTDPTTCLAQCIEAWESTAPLLSEVFGELKHPESADLFAAIIDHLGERLPVQVGESLAELITAITMEPESTEEATALAAEQPTIRLLCVPDWRIDSWKDPIDTYLTNFTSADPVALVLRIEPQLPEMAELAQSLVTAIVNNCGQQPENCADIVIEATPLEVDQEYLLYGSCHAYISCEGGHNDRFLAKCAEHNVPILEDMTTLKGDQQVVSAAQASFEAPEIKSRPPISAIIVTQNSESEIGESIERLLKCLQPQDEVLVVDNHSTDQTTAIVEAFSERGVSIIRSSRNLGFANGLMVGAEKASHELVAVIKPDAYLVGAVIDRLVSHIEAHENIAAVGPTTDTILSDQHVSLALPGIDLNEFNAETLAAGVAEIRDGLSSETKLLSSLCTLYRRQSLLEIAPEVIDLFAYGEDLTISYELRKRGLRLLVAQDAFVTGGNTTHLESANGLKQNYLNKQAANLVYEKLYRDYQGQVPSGEEVFGVNWFAPQTEKTSIIVLAWNNLELTKECITSIYEHTQRDFELIIIDNGSEDDVARYVAELKSVEDNVVFIRNSENQGYAFGCNQGIHAATGEYIVLLNNDIVCTPGWLSKQLAVLKLDDSIGIVGPRTNYAGGPQMVHDVPYKSLTEMLDYAYEWGTDHAGQVALLSRLTGLCMVMNRRVVEAVGGLDTTFGIGNFEDDDFSLRVMRAGFKIALVNDVFIHHYGSATFRKMDIDYEAIMRENFEVFSAKWGTTHQIHEHFNAVELAQSEAWMNARDYIEPNYSKVFHPQCPAMKIEGNPAARFLCVPDWDNPSWMGVVLSYIENTPTGNSTALVLRVEPCTQQRIEAIIDQIGKLFAAQNINPETIPDIVLETTPIHSGDRGSLYTACDVLIPCEGSRAHIYLREAKACGLAIAGENTPSSKSDKQQEDAVLV